MNREKKIFCVSFHKSGTTSLHHFFKAAGIDSKHCPRYHDGKDIMRNIAPFIDEPQKVLEYLAPIVKLYQGHSDVPWPGLYPEILETYPDSRFILLLRDAPAWWNSVARHWNLNTVDRYMTAYEYIQYRPYIDRPSNQLVSITDGPVFESAYLRHTETVIRTIPSGQLLIVDLNDPDISKKISQFLCLERVVDFPSVTNKTSLKPWRKIASRFVRRAYHFLGFS